MTFSALGLLCELCQGMRRHAHRAFGSSHVRERVANASAGERGQKLTIRVDAIDEPTSNSRTPIRLTSYRKFFEDLHI